MKQITYLYISLFSLLLVVGSTMPSSSSVGKVDIANLFSKSSETYYIKKEIDLQGKVVHIAPDCELVFSRKARIANGVLVGNNTRIVGTKNLFDGVTIKGTWHVPYISTEMFVSLDYINSLRDVIALSNSQIHNIITVQEGDYFVSTDDNNLAGIALKSKTKLVLDGIIRLKPNEQKRSYVVLVENCSNVMICGCGKILGDKSEHLGIDGEWGMGVYVTQSNNVSISGVSIYNCWGDCICVCKDSKRVLIQDCCIYDGRRQGVSIIDGKDIIIRNCLIANVGGTNPEYAIDIEPDSNGHVKDVLIDNVVVEDCKGGFMVYAKAKNAFVENVEFRECKIAAIEKYPLRFEGGSSIKVVGCNIEAQSVPYCILARDANNLLFENNIIYASKRVFRQISNATVINNKIVCKDLLSAYDELYFNVVFFNNRIEGRVDGDFKDSRFEYNEMIGKRSSINIPSEGNIVRQNKMDE